MSINNLSSIRKTALIAAFAILTMAFAAFFSLGVALDPLIAKDNINLTISNIKAAELLFRFGILGWIIIFICDLVAAWSLHLFFKSSNQNLSLITAWFRLIYTAILGISISHLILVAAQINTAPLSGQSIGLALERFRQIWSFGLIIFGFHLLGLGYLVLKFQTIPKVLGILLILAAFGYIINNVANLLILNYEVYQAIIEMIFMLPMILGELGLAVWLLLKGGKPN